MADTRTELERTEVSETSCLQTWHGTPPERIHHDVLRVPEGRLDRFGADVTDRVVDLLLARA